MTVEALASTLLREGLIPPASVLDGTLEATDVSRHCRNHRFTWGGGRGVLIKQPPPGGGPSRRANVEVTFYRLCQAPGTPGALRALLPRCLGTLDHGAGLVLELVPGAGPLSELPTGQGWPVALTAVGRALGTFHRLASTPAFRARSRRRALPACRPAVFGLQRPGPELLGPLSAANVATLSFIESEGGLAAHLQALERALRPSTLIHGDLRLDNLLVATTGGVPRVWLLDWELAGRGDPAWDLGAVLEGLLERWLLRVPASRPVPEPREKAEAQASAHAFWEAYREAAGVSPASEGALLHRAVLASAAWLVLRAFEHAQCSARPPAGSLRLLQVAVDLFAEPAALAHRLHGLTLPRHVLPGR